MPRFNDRFLAALMLLLLTGFGMTTQVGPAAGNQEVVWDGRDGQGRSVASGTYCARLIVGELHQVRALTLVR